MLIAGFLANNLKISKNTLAIVAISLVPLCYFSLVSIGEGEFFPRQTYSWAVLVMFTTLGLKVQTEFTKKLIVWAAVIWGVVGAIQCTFYSRFLHWMVYRMHSSNDRGVTSLAVEPSIYGDQILLLACAYILLCKGRFKRSIRNSFFALLVLSQLWFLSQAASSLLFGAVVIVSLFMVLIRSRVIQTCLIFVALYWAATGFNISLSGRRGDLFVKTTSVQRLLKDPSVQERAANIVYPLIIFWNELPMAVGFAPAVDRIETLRLKYQDKETFGWGFASSRISSGWGTVLFQLGIVGCFWASILGIASLTQETFIARVAGLGFMFLMWTAIPWATPLVGVICGLLFKGSYFRLNKFALLRTDNGCH